MAKMPGAVSLTPSAHGVIIYELPTGTAAILEPGLLEVRPGDTVEYSNRTGTVARLVVAEDGLLARVPSMVPQDIASGMTRNFTVDPGAVPGTHEYQIAVTLGSGKKVFAIGASTPRIIIRSSSDVG